ncbi:hypothetical protein [Desulfoplanes sp.]
MPNTTRLFVLAALLVALCSSTGCGLKVWPEPRAQEDRFSWEGITATSRDTCLDINATLEGAYGNLSRVDLELAPADEECPSCPFQARQTISFDMDDSRITRDGPNLALVYCQLPTTTGFRWRIVGYNVHPSLQSVPSEVMFVEKAER